MVVMLTGKTTNSGSDFGSLQGKTTHNCGSDFDSFQGKTTHNRGSDFDSLQGKTTNNHGSDFNSILRKTTMLLPGHGSDVHNPGPAPALMTTPRSKWHRGLTLPQMDRRQPVLPHSTQHLFLEAGPCVFLHLQSCCCCCCCWSCH